MEATGSITELAQQLADARRAASYADAVYRGRYILAMETIGEFTEAKIATAELLGKAEVALRMAALLRWQETGEKHLAPGVEVRVGVSLVYDAQAAFKWALDHKVALSLDKKVFEKVASASCPELVTLEDKPVATIATGLETLYPATVAPEKVAANGKE